MKVAGFIEKDQKDNDIIDKLLHGEFKELMSHARVRNLIEFGRVVHAEMHAISQAAASGRSVRGATLYCTTFPCHGCARHLISSGISEVVYIEPYPKSLTLQLYDKEIEVTHLPSQAGTDSKSVGTPVSFRAFHGVSPTLYQRVFRQRDRKDKMGRIVKWNPKVALPVGASFGVDRPSFEIAASTDVAKIYEALKTVSESQGEENTDAGE